MHTCVDCQFDCLTASPPPQCLRRHACYHFVCPARRARTYIWVVRVQRGCLQTRTPCMQAISCISLRSMETHDEGSTPVQQQEHKSKHRSKDKDRDKKEKRDRKDKSSKSSRHDRDLSAATDRPVDIANGRAETDAIAAANGLRTSPPAQAPAQHAPAEDRAAAQQPADRKAAPVVNDSGGEISMSIEETNRCSSCVRCHMHTYIVPTGDPHRALVVNALLHAGSECRSV